MSRPSSPPYRSDGSSAVTVRQETGGESPAGAVGAPAEKPHSNPVSEGSERSPGRSEPTGEVPDSPSRTGIKTIPSPDGLLGFQSRSIFRHLPRRSSSGYFSYDGDSLPSSPFLQRPVTADKATQTPSPSGQVIRHAVQRMAEAFGGGPGAHRGPDQQQQGSPSSPFSMRPPNPAGDMQAEIIGRELRRMGDDYNRLFMLRRFAGRHGWINLIHPNPLPHIHWEPAILLCTGLLLLMIGRILYLQGSMNSHPDHAQV